MYIIKTINTNTFKRLLIAPGMGMKTLINHRPTPKTTINAIKFNSSFIIVLIRELVCLV